MLVIQRKVGEGYWIGEDIFVRVVRLDRGRVGLGIQAPREWRIERSDAGAPMADNPVKAASSQSQPRLGSHVAASQQTVPESG